MFRLLLFWETAEVHLPTFLHSWWSYNLSTISFQLEQTSWQHRRSSKSRFSRIWWANISNPDSISLIKMSKLLGVMLNVEKQPNLASKSFVKNVSKWFFVSKFHPNFFRKLTKIFFVKFENCFGKICSGKLGLFYQQIFVSRLSKVTLVGVIFQIKNIFFASIRSSFVKLSLG